LTPPPRTPPKNLSQEISYYDPYPTYADHSYICHIFQRRYDADGRNIRLGEAGDVDAILVHSQKAEEAFVAAGYGTHRREIMYNDFVIIGPTDDPAKIRDAKSAAEALRAIVTSQSLFVSRGDDSGTHKKELSLWSSTGIKDEDLGPWYRAVGAGMGASLNTAAGMGAYILSDIQFSGDPVLFNQYAYLSVNPQRHAHVKHDLAVKLETWLTSLRAAEIINTYTIDDQTLFTFNAE